MKIRIIETGEIKELTIIGANGCEWTQDLLGNNNAVTYNNESEQYEMSQDDFEWWEEYINNYIADEKEIKELAEELGIDESEIYERINDFISNDLEDEHNINQNVIAEFKNR